MAVAFRSSQSVTNGTAGTSVTVTKPAGIVDTGSNPARDQLIAMIACTGAPTITAPAGWTLVQTIASTTAVTLACYRKLASSEGASWTWTLSASQRNWGWVGAYTGVDPTSPVAFSYTIPAMSTTTTILDTQVASPGQIAVLAGAATRAATGVATTWTETGTTFTTVERADLSTNAGAGTDITGVVTDAAWSASYSDENNLTLTASQTQTVGVGVDVNLRPYFVPYNGGKLTGLIVEAALGADISTDQSTWTWTAVRVHYPSDVTITVGRSNGTSRADPSRISFTVLNLNGEWTSPTGAYSQYLVRNLPFRVRINSIGIGHTGGYQRGTAFLASARPRWASDGSTRFAVVDIVAQGQLRRLQQGIRPSHSAAYRSLLIGTGPGGFTPIAYWPFEDQSGSTSALSPIPGCQPASTSGVTFASDSTFLGSAPLARLSASSTIVGTMPTYPVTGAWTIGVAMNIPAEPAASTCIIQMATSGTALAWQIGITPGASVFTVSAYSATGNILSQSVSFTESDIYGHPVFWGLSVVQSGADVSYEATGIFPSGTTYSSIGKIGTLAGFTCGQLLNFSVPAQAGLASAGVGQVVVYAETTMTATGPEFFTRGGTVVTGNAGEHPWARFQRLTDEDGIDATYSASENLELTMGPQGVATLIDLLRECETVEGNVMHDAGSLTFNPDTGLLTFPARDERDNRAADLTLDIDLRHIQPGFEPTLDDLTIRNDVEVSRSGGGSARVADDASIAREGLYREQVTVNTADDLYLGDLAGIRVAAGTVAGMRFPNVEWDLRSTPDLAETWLACQLGDRVDITHPPSQYPPDAIRSYLEGYTETLSTTKWRVRANLSPASANRVFLLATDTADTGEYVGRLEPDTCNLLVAVTSSATSWKVFTDPGWTTDPDDYPVTVRIGGEVVTLPANSPITRDTFTRTTANGWGTPDVGSAWTVNEGTAAGFSTNGTLAIQSHSTIANRSMVIDVGTPDHDISVLFRIPVAPTGGSAAAIVDLRCRRTDDNNFYYVRVSANAAGTMAFTFNKTVGGAGSTLLTGTSLTLDTSATYGLRLSADGSTIKAKFWNNTTTAEPDWQLTVLDSSLVTGNTVSVFSIPLSVTNVLPFDYYFDTFNAINPKTTSAASCAQDTFTRTVSNSWSTATTGQTWLNDFTDADGDVNGSAGTIQPTTLSSDYNTWFDVFSTNVDLRAGFSLNTLPATNAMRFGLVGRVTDGDTNYRGEVSVSTAGVMTLQLVKKVATVVTVLTSITMGGVLATATSYTIRLRVVGSKLQVRMWKTTDPEPAWWVEWTDTVLTTGTSAGVFVRNDSASNTRIVTIDNFEVTEPKTWTVTRAVNTVAKAQSTGAIAIDQPNLLGM